MKRIAALFLAWIMGLSMALAEEIWVPREAPAVRAALSEEEKAAAQQAILDQGEMMFTGMTNQSFKPFGTLWLKQSQPKDAIAIVYACDDVTHGGWGVLGLATNGKQMDITAFSDRPDKERLMMLTIQELMDFAGIDSPDQFSGFQVGAWNGGRIAGFYFLKADTAAQLQAHLDQVAQTEQVIHTYSGALSNPNATENTRAVYAYLQQVNGSACLTGQMESTWMGSPDYEMNYIKDATGKLPAIRGLDFMHNDFAGVVRRAKAWWADGGIPTICWHTGADFASGYNESKDHNINWEEAFIPGSGSYNALLQGMDRAVPYLQQLEDADVPVLWRPFHELDGGWFWWSKGGSEHFVKLWQMMYSRYTDYWGLDNLIWVLGYSGNGGSMAAWYPGDSYVDVIGADSYTAGANGRLYEEVQALAPAGMPIVFHECGSIPTQAQMQADAAPWAMFMVWHTDHLTKAEFNTRDSLNAIYNSDYFITLDELPAF